MKRQVCQKRGELPTAALRTCKHTHECARFVNWLTQSGVAILCLPNEDFGKRNSRSGVSFRGTLRGCEYSIWATNARKITRQDTPDPRFRFPKSSFGEHIFLGNVVSHMAHIPFFDKPPFSRFSNYFNHDSLLTIWKNREKAGLSKRGCVAHAWKRQVCQKVG